MAKTTAKHFEFFQEECLKWVEVFGLRNWEIAFKHEKYDDSNYATTQYNWVSGWANIYLEVDWGKDHPVTKAELKRTALHEVLEIVLAPLYALTQEEGIFPRRAEGAAHDIIRRMENVFFNDEED